MGRSCQRHTDGFDTPACAYHLRSAAPSALADMIRARHTAFAGVGTTDQSPPDAAVTFSLQRYDKHLPRPATGR